MRIGIVQQYLALQARRGSYLEPLKSDHLKDGKPVWLKKNSNIWSKYPKPQKRGEYSLPMKTKSITRWAGLESFKQKKYTLQAMVNSWIN